MNTSTSAVGKKYNFLYAGLQCSFWCYYAPIWTFVAVILDHYGFSGKEVGTLTAASTLLSIIVQPMLADAADKSTHFRSREITVAMSFAELAAGLLLLLCPLSNGSRALLFGLLGLLLFCIPPFFNSLATDLFACGIDLDYSSCRSLASVGYALMVAIVGSFVRKSDPRLAIVLFLAVLAVCMLFLRSCRLPDHGQVTASAAKALGTFAFLKANPLFIVALLGAVFYYGCHMTFNTYYYAVVDRALLTDSAVMGITLGLAAFFELPGMRLFSRLKGKISCETFLLISALFAFSKAFLYIVSPSAIGLYCSAALTVFENGFYIPAAVYYVSDTVSAADQAKGQGMMYAAGCGLGGALGNFCGGWLLDLGSVVNALLFAAGCGLMSAVCFCICLRKRGGK